MVPIDSEHARLTLDEILGLTADLANEYETICASEHMIGKAQESFSALKQAASAMQAIADSAALRCEG